MIYSDSSDLFRQGEHSDDRNSRTYQSFKLIWSKASITKLLSKADCFLNEINCSGWTAKMTHIILNKISSPCQHQRNMLFLDEKNYVFINFKGLVFFSSRIMNSYHLLSIWGSTMGKKCIVYALATYNSYKGICNTGLQMQGLGLLHVYSLHLIVISMWLLYFCTVHIAWKQSNEYTVPSKILEFWLYFLEVKKFITPTVFLY